MVATKIRYTSRYVRTHAPNVVLYFSDPDDNSMFLENSRPQRPNPDHKQFTIFPSYSDRGAGVQTAAGFIEGSIEKGIHNPM